MRHNMGDFKSMEDLISKVKSIQSPKGANSSEVGWDIDTHPPLSLTYEHALKGWPVGLERIKKAQTIALKNAVRHLPETEINRTVCSDWCDIGDFMIGRPDCYYEESETDEETETPTQQFIKIVYSVGASGGVHPETIIKRGAAIGALVNSLELSGRRVSLTAYSTIKNRINSDTLGMTVTIKEFGDPLQLDGLSFLAHPSFLRRLVFKLREGQSDTIRRQFGIRRTGGYGRSIEDTTLISDINIPPATGGGIDWNDEQQVEQWIVESLRNQGIETIE